MKKLIETFRNIFKIEELRNRILFTLLLLAIYRIGSFVILPGIDSKSLEELFKQQQGTGILALINTFVGGSFSRGSIFALGIMPYISASIIIQLMAAVVPAVTKMQREGESGTRKLNQYTRYLSVLITAVQAAAYVVNLQQYKQAIIAEPWQFWTTTVFVLTAGTLFLVWMGERITDNGIGNGVSLIIAIGIIADLPLALITEYQASPLMIFFVEIIALAVVIMLVILLTEGVRQIPVNYAKRMVGAKNSGGMAQNAARQYIPLKLNASGVMPIIFAQAIMFIPATVAQFFPESDFWIGTGSYFNDFKSIPYNAIFVTLIIVFTYFYTAIAVNPNDISENLKRQGGFIPGVKPGDETSEYIDDVLTKITLPGSLFLATIAILPAVVASFGVSQQFALFFGGTSLLIMIGVVLDTLRQIESHLLMRHYDGLMSSGRVGTPSGRLVGAEI